MSLTSNVDDTFYVTESHTGNTRVYSGSHLKYSITVTDANGNATNNILVVRFCQNGIMLNLLNSRKYAIINVDVKSKVDESL